MDERIGYQLMHTERRWREERRIRTVRGRECGVFKSLGEFCQNEPRREGRKLSPRKKALPESSSPSALPIVDYLIIPHSALVAADTGGQSALAAATRT